MCQLLKYFESEDTIFLLMDYHKYGSLYPHMLRLIRDSIHNFPHNLPQLFRFAQSINQTTQPSSFPQQRGEATSSKNAHLSTSVTEASEQSTQPRRLHLSHSFSGAISAVVATATTPKSSPPMMEDVFSTAEISLTSGDKRRTQSHSHAIKFTVFTPVDIADTTNEVFNNTLKWL